MWNIKIHVSIGEDHEDHTLDAVRMFVASRGETTIYDARNGLPDKSFGTIFNCFKRLQRLDEIAVYRREAGGRGKIWYGLTKKGFCVGLIKFHQLRKNFVEYARTWYDYDRFRQKPLGEITFDIRPYLENKKLAEAVRDWIIYGTQRWFAIPGLSMSWVGGLEDSAILTWKSELRRYVDVLDIPDGRLADLYLGVPEVRPPIDKAVDEEMQRLDALEAWRDELRKDVLKVEPTKEATKF